MNATAFLTLAARFGAAGRLARTLAAAAAAGAGVMLAPPALLAAPPMGGGYTDVVAIPVDDPAVKEIAGALIKPEGEGPFPVVVYIPPCGGPNFPLELQQETFVSGRLVAKGVAVFIVDPFMPRGLEQGNCDKLLTVLDDVKNKKEATLQLLKQGGDDAAAAVKAVKALPGIDPKKVFVMGFSYGATASLYAADPNGPSAHDPEIAGVIAYYPLCYDNIAVSVPTLIMIGSKDDWTGPVAACEALKGKGNFDVVVYPDATHAFSLKFDQPVEFAGHRMAYDEAATMDAMQRTEAFLSTQLK